MPVQTPAALGFAMPAEWETHEATWLGWPHCRSDWPGKLGAIEWVYGEIVRKLAVGEKVRIVIDRAREARARRVLARAHADLGNVEFFHCASDRGWSRDFGPVCVRRPGPRPEVAVVKFKFTAWAKYGNWKKDDRIAALVAKRRRMRMFPVLRNGVPVALEGGGIEVNGRGTLVATEECFLDQETQCRNPGMSRADYERVFFDYLGGRNVLWLGEGIVGDDTHGHVDDLCRFVNRDTLVLVQEKNEADINHRPLRDNWERLQDVRLEDGSKPDVIALPMPAPIFYDKWRLPASYANFYFANSAVLVPTFNDPADREALGILGELVRDRPVVGIHAVDLVLGFGTLHCLTQQQPARG
ncbi:MAG: agmatine deiminase family protein [Deltaproteobacteria bacterium]|nr:agmatine deiminase family protein [Deltaproteobacteria bacterium]